MDPANPQYVLLYPGDGIWEPLVTKIVFLQNIRLYAALERNLLDKFPPNLQKTYHRANISLKIVTVFEFYMYKNVYNSVLLYYIVYTMV